MEKMNVARALFFEHGSENHRSLIPTINLGRLRACQLEPQLYWHCSQSSPNRYGGTLRADAKHYVAICFRPRACSLPTRRQKLTG